MRPCGVTSSLVDMVEIRPIGDNAGHAWQVAIAGTDTVLPLADRAVATSFPDGFHFDTAVASATSSTRAPERLLASTPA